MHGALDIFYNVLDTYSIQPEDIKEINIALNLLAELPLWKNRKIESHIDAQFSTAYVFAVAAHRVEIGHKWQAEETYNDSAILEFMERINVFTQVNQDYDKARHMVEVVVYDKNTKKQKLYTEGDVRFVNNIVDDEELYEKFKNNAEGLVSTKDTEQALRMILSLEELDNIGHLMSLLSFYEE
jgi:2-methylcitrate dehydratase PrpD